MKELHPNQQEGISGGRDETDIISFNVSYTAYTLEECETVAQGVIVNGLPEDSRQWSSEPGGTLKVDVLYRGKRTDNANDRKVKTNVETSWQEEPIEAHPDIVEILEKYEGQLRNGTVYFKPTYTPKVDSNAPGAGLNKDAGKEKKNPFFGVTKYKRLTVIFTRTYSMFGYPGALLAGVGKVVSRPPDAPADLPSRRKWLVLPPSASGLGNVNEITERYELLDESTPEELYKKADIKGAR